MICAGGARAWGSVLGAQVLADVCDERGLGDLGNGPQFAATSRGQVDRSMANTRFNRASPRAPLQ